MSTKRLLFVTAMLEAGAGAALFTIPSASTVLLLGSPLEGSAAVTLGRVTGVALLALGVANWFAQYDAQGRATKGILGAMVVYNLGAVLVLGTAGILSQPVGILLWPGVALHSAMAVWCVVVLAKKAEKQAK